MSAIDDLEREVARFRAQAEAWDDLYGAVERVLADVPTVAIPPRTREHLLYALARDAARGRIAAALLRHPETALILAKDGVSYADHEARRQLASLLGRLPADRDVIEDILRVYARDPHEAVRRRALLAMEACEHSSTERFALEAWGSPDERVRAAALSTFVRIGAAALPGVLAAARRDRSAIVRAAAGAAPVTVTFDEDGIAATGEGGDVRRIAWGALREVAIVTTAEGPFDEDVFFALVADEDELIVPQSAADSLLARLQALPGFDGAAAIEAMSSAGEARFVCWRRR